MGLIVALGWLYRVHGARQVAQGSELYYNTGTGRSDLYNLVAAESNEVKPPPFERAAPQYRRSWVAFDRDEYMHLQNDDIGMLNFTLMYAPQ